MMNTLARTVRLGTLTLGIAGMPALGLSQPEDAGTGASPPADFLRGPAVPEGTVGSLARTDMMGTFRRVEGRPEIAAFVRLDTDESARERAMALADARAERLRLLLVDEIDLVRASTDALLAGDQARAQQLSARLRDTADPGGARDPLLDELCELLDDETAGRLRASVDAYWDAWIDERLPEGADAEDPRVRARVAQELEQQLFQEEIREAYDASLRRYREALESIYIAVDPTPEQRETIRSIVIEHVRETRLDATPTQRREAMRAIYRALDDERREKLFMYVTQSVLPDG